MMSITRPVTVNDEVTINMAATLTYERGAARVRRLLAGPAILWLMFNIEISFNANDGTWSWIVSKGDEWLHGYGAGLETREECEVFAQRHINRHSGW